MTKPANPPLAMPRRLAIRLLHEAQIAVEPFAGLVSAPLEAGAEPELWHPAASESAVPALRAAIEAAGRRVWALYSFRPQLPAMPVLQDFAAQPGLLRLSASLATKGVLQLRAWQRVESGVVERELHVHD